MPDHPLAGKPIPPNMITNIPRLVSAYYSLKPDPDELTQRVEFGTNGHRGCSFDARFNENHVLAITQAICSYRRRENIKGPLFLGMDTHALSEPAHMTAIEVLAANGVDVIIAENGGYTPTPVISHAILNFNFKDKKSLADGIVITPSHNPPTDGGFKYNSPTGGPADTKVTKWIENEANRILSGNNQDVKRMNYTKALRSDNIHEHNYIVDYINDLDFILDMELIKSAGLKICADALGGSGLNFWHPIADRYKLNIFLRNEYPDPTFRFMSLDKDGKIRMDCSSAASMSQMIELKNGFDIAFGNDPDFDRHGIVTPSGGLMNPNHFLAVSIWYLFQHRPKWSKNAAIGKTLVSSSMIDKVASNIGRQIYEVPVGFKWFVDCLLKNTCTFGGEESAGASFSRKNGKVWTTDKDGFIMDLIAAEITAKIGKDPSQIYHDLTVQFGEPVYLRFDAPIDRNGKNILLNLEGSDVDAKEFADEPIKEILTRAPGNGIPIGGLKVITENGWFAARPSGTEDIYKVYAESFKGKEHLEKIMEEAKSLVDKVLAK